MNTVKWGFGMAPLKPSTESKNRAALSIVQAFVVGNSYINFETLPDNISWVKGIFNRVIQQDQWDWFTVNMYLDYPPLHDLLMIVNGLQNLRKAILTRDPALGKAGLLQLNNSHFLRYCNSYLHFDITPEEYLYILSRREEKEILKIGMTSRNVQTRVNEINSATGVLYPYSVRKVFKVKNAKKVEKEIHILLDKCRIRPDREFFKIEYSLACSIIDNYLTATHQYYYNSIKNVASVSCVKITWYTGGYTLSPIILSYIIFHAGTSILSPDFSSTV